MSKPTLQFQQEFHQKIKEITDKKHLSNSIVFQQNGGEINNEGNKFGPTAQREWSIPNPFSKQKPV